MVGYVKTDIAGPAVVGKTGSARPIGLQSRVLWAAGTIPAPASGSCPVHADYPAGASSATWMSSAARESAMMSGAVRTEIALRTPIVLQTTGVLEEDVPWTALATATVAWARFATNHRACALRSAATKVDGVAYGAGNLLQGASPANTGRVTGSLRKCREFAG